MNTSNTPGPTPGETLPGFLQTGVAGLPWGPVLVALLVLTICTWRFFPSSDRVSAPFAGFRSSLEPGFITRLRFATGASGIIGEGYSKWKDSRFRISRTDGDLLVVSRKYLDELHNMPLDRLSSIKGLVKNFGGHYSGIGLLAESDIGTRALQSKITPNLAKLSDAMREELEYALQKEVPSCADWTSVSIQPMLLNIAVQISQRVLIGLPLCRNREWLDAASTHSHNVTMTQMAMRTVPPVLRPLLDLVLPTAWRYKAAVRRGKEIIIPEIQRRRQLEETDTGYVKPVDLLQGMMDLAAPGDKESEAENLAHRQLLVTLVAGHSTAAAGSHALLDAVAQPHYLNELRSEALQVLQEEGGEWKRQSVSKLWKMDSFLRESQRLSPPSLLGFHRVVQDPTGITLHDGVHLPHGTHICMAPHSVSSDPAIVPKPDVFDGLRYYERRRKNPDEATRHQHATADKDHLHFGYGTWSCPGRFLASAELKMILVELLLRYEFKYPKGSSRPKNRNIEEFPYVDTDTPLLMRRRGQVEDEEGLLMAARGKK
ncbi:cytochrome p450 [Hirsutella rhossiliensis]|uniref:Cytochrome p450 domain-containing protein n=1 Tax=Hirsutella rhossiliensis TaxID=111463 RepID=A0A9P8SGY2_9HYPO|nr:cytochrome p450 domain-containing protein [Hirsutella rhossiliensis]KAH0960965.1 cytochrome p450 domain-containing protein [Hirsutella rhossiliensis]